MFLRRLLLLGQLGLSELHFVDLGQLVQRFQPEGSQKIGRRAEQGRPPRHIQLAAFLDQMLVEQRADAVGAVDAADLLDVRARGRLILGHDRQRLELRGRKLRRLARLKRFCYIGRHLA